MQKMIRHLNAYYKSNNKSFSVEKTVACCCGHNKYPMTIVVKDKYGNIYELFSQKVLPRKKKFYKKDEEGYYFIPETLIV